ncbi:hypothetical protein ACM9HF_17810 [Colwellia sp. RE-S-Sl-9]
MNNIYLDDRATQMADDFNSAYSILKLTLLSTANAVCERTIFLNVDLIKSLQCVSDAQAITDEMWDQDNKGILFSKAFTAYKQISTFNHAITELATSNWCEAEYPNELIKAQVSAIYVADTLLINAVSLFDDLMINQPEQAAA